jgi:hypothetical protein
MLRPRAAVLIALAVLTGCFPDYFPRHHLRVKLSPTDMAGHWHLGRDSARMLARYRVPVSTANSWIDFFTDGQCELHNFVDEEQVLTGKATWKLDEEPDQAWGTRSTSVLHIMFQTPERPVTFSLYFTRHHHRYVLWQYHSDPDGREYIEYESI